MIALNLSPLLTGILYFLPIWDLRFLSEYSSTNHRSEKLEKLIKEEQEDRVIGANIYTINTYIINTINEIKSKRIFRFSKYDIKLLTEYCKLIRDKNHILHKCRTREVNEILSLCYDKDFPRIFDTKEQHKYPVIKNLKILERSLNSLSNINESKLFIHHLTNIIITSSNLEDMKYLVHLLNEKYSIDSILNVVKKIFSEAFFSSYKSKIYDTIQNRDDISRKIENIYSQIVENMFLFIRSNNQENLDEFLKDFFYDNAKWKSVLNFLVHDSKNSFTIIYDKMNNIPDVKLSLDSNVTDNFATLLSNIIKKSWNIYFSMVRHTLKINSILEPVYLI